MYGDIVLEYPDILQDLPRDIIIMDWHYDVKNHYDSTDLFKKSGLPFIVSPGNQNWSRIFPELEHSIQNIHQFIQNGHFNGASGAITSSWGDFGGANLRELNYYQIAYAANCAWNKNNNDITQFNKSFFRDFYGSDDPGFANAYHILSHISEYYDLNYLYSHPFYQPVSEIDKLNGRSIELEQIYKKLNIKLQRLRTIAKRNKTHLDILEFCGTLYHWTALLNQLQIALYKAQKSSSDLLIKQITLLENKLTGIKSTFKTLWLRYNKEDNLHKIIELMDRVQKYLLIKKAEIQTGNLEFNGRLESPFISFPLNKKTKNFNPVIYLRKKFILNESINATWLQAIADSHATIWINEHYIGELVATRTLSAVVEAERVKMWEVSKYLKKGENILAVKVINYKPSGNASVNIFLNCPEVNSRIKGDETWKAYNREEKNWQALDFAAQHWENAVKSENNWIISRPYFDHQLTSRIEFFKNPIY